MEISPKLPGADLAQLQSVRPPQRAGETAAAAPAGGVEPDVRVSISAEARAAEEAARTRTLLPGGAVTAPEALESADPVTAPAPVERLREPVAATATQDVAAGRLASPGGEAGVSRPAEPAAAQGAREGLREPDAASAANSQAVQLYRENAARAVGQPVAAPIRASA
jgi:hypothetical protein